MKTESQNQRILKHFEKGFTLTPLQAMQKFDSMNLAQRVKELRNEGFDITGEMIKLKSGKRVKKYWLNK
jgi:hypothetical protein